MVNKFKELMDQPIQIDLEKLREQKYEIQIATPAFGGLYNDLYHRAMMATIGTLSSAGIPMHTSTVTNDSLVTRARNICVAMFLANPKATHLMFIDSDIGFRGDYIIKMLWDTMDKDIDVICGAYPKKAIKWPSIIRAIKDGHTDPKTIELHNDNFVINLAQQTLTLNNRGLLEVLDPGTGFMLITRKAIEKLIKAYPQLKYENDVEAVNTKWADHLYALFDTGIEGQGVLSHIKKTKRYLSEDYFFARLCQKQNIKVWMDPRIHLQHQGSYVYAGDITNMFKIEGETNGETRS